MCEAANDKCTNENRYWVQSAVVEVNVLACSRHLAKAVEMVRTRALIEYPALAPHVTVKKKTATPSTYPYDGDRLTYIYK